jgi:uncharacterized MAPEG superfamily protein
MTTAFWCILVAGVMPYLFTAIAKGSGERYNNRDPRGWQARLAGLPARAHAAHLNSFEAFPFFAAAVIVAQLAQAPQERIDALALAFIALRLAYGVCYLANWPMARSLVWLAAFGCTVAMFVAAA